MAHDVFISHSSKDKVYADAVCARLESEEIRCWIAPRDILPGTAWGGAIVEAIEAARLMVLVFSSNANTSPQIEREVERALNKGLVIVPLRIEEVIPGKSLEYFLGTPHWLDAVTPPFERHLEYIAKTIKVLLARGESGRTAEIPRPPVTAAPATIPRASAAPWRLVGGIAVPVVLLIALAWYFMAGGPVPSKFVGAWTTINFVGPDKVQFVLRVGPGGGYRYEVTYKESGRVKVRDGQVFLQTADGLERPVGPVAPASDPPSPGNLLAAAPAGVWGPVAKFSHASVDFPRGNPFVLTQSGNSPARAGARAKVWEWDTAFGKVAWQIRFEFDHDGDYTFTAHAIDVGRLIARKGKWKAISDVLDSQSEGGYYFVGNDTLVLAGTIRGAAATSTLGNALWERLGSAPTTAARTAPVAAAAPASPAGFAPITATPTASPTAAATPAPPPIMAIDRKFLLSRDSPVYAGPDSSSALVAQVRRGRYVHITGLTGNWLQVKLPGEVVGFIPDEAVE